MDILEVSFKNKKERGRKKQDEMILESTSLVRKNSRVQNFKKEISRKLQNQNKEDYKNLKERCKKSKKKKKRR